IAEEILESGTPVTTSASILASRASTRPRFFLAEWTLIPCISLSGREKYTYSIVQIAFEVEYEKNSECNPSSLTMINSPGKTSQTNAVPIISNAHVSDATQ